MGKNSSRDEHRHRTDTDAEIDATGQRQCRVLVLNRQEIAVTRDEFSAEYQCMVRENHNFLTHIVEHFNLTFIP